MTKLNCLFFMLIFITGCGLLHTNLQAGGTEIKNSFKPQNGEWDFRPEKVWEVIDAGDDVLVGVRRIRVDSDGKVFVFDRKHFKFFVFSPEGKFLYSFGKKGEGPGEFKLSDDNMVFLKVEKDRLLVNSVGRISYFSKEGEYQSERVNNAGLWLQPLGEHFVGMKRLYDKKNLRHR